MTEDLRRRVRDFLAARPFTPRCDSWAGSYDLGFSRELGEAGLLAVSWPERLGGGGGTAVDRLAVTEELLRAGAPLAAHWVGERQIGPALLRHGSPELREEFCPPLARAECTFALGMSEPDAGSDLASLRTSAVRDGDGWRVTGRKIWTSGAHRASHLYVLARTSREADRHDGLTEFVVALDSPGITVTPILDVRGEHHFNEVGLDEVAVPDRWVIGRAGEGWRQVVGQLAFERGGPERFLSTYPLLSAVLDAGLADGIARSGLRALAARLQILRAWVLETARVLDAGGSPVVPAATSKYLGHQFELSVIEWARPLMPRAAPEVRALYDQALAAAPASGLRGGAAPVMLSMIAKDNR
ncbi:acyl-CoA dehydrogenase family protein [Amycolatopsis rubida]|uniref:Acyl-CoA dehydrogenase n=1 Tax=Amycolatopsis rubida TaxID=112413 RepID=A0A1I5S1V8_9PSEU|nr:acyl-CoA dehydrogenase family protein [Amycolatopsis rubida]SFP64276.1 Acyl-CoA dehydrogenase [Amycolatopsis rubida]